MVRPAHAFLITSITAFMMAMPFVRSAWQSASWGSSLPVKGLAPAQPKKPPVQTRRP